MNILIIRFSEMADCRLQNHNYKLSLYHGSCMINDD